MCWDSACAELTILNPLHPDSGIYILHIVILNFPHSTDKENLFDLQNLLKLVILSHILMTFIFDSIVVL